MTNVRIFRHHIPMSLLVLFVGEVAAMVAAVYIGAHLRFLGSPDAIPEYIGALAPRAILFAAVATLSLSSIGLYQAHLRLASRLILFRVGLGFIFTTLLMVLIFYIFPSIYIGRGAYGMSLAISFIAVASAHTLYFHFIDHDLLKRRVLVLGAGRRAAALNRWLRRKSDQRSFRILAFVPMTDDVCNETLEPIISPETSLSAYAIANDIEEIVVAMDERRIHLPTEELLHCRLEGIRITDAASFIERETGKVKLDLIYPSWLIFEEGYHQSPIQELAKRFLDIVACIILMMVTAPIMLITAMAIMIENGWRAPVLYRQVRVGENGKHFDILKFRSMVVNAEKHGAQWAQNKDPRITKVGGLIRKLRIDELPQVFNVLNGQMSLVGPRPERPEFIAELAEKIPYYSERHRVKPGITGWAQLKYPYGASVDDAAEKLQYDLYYVKNRGLMLDIMAIIQTVEVVLFGKGAR